MIAVPDGNAGRVLGAAGRWCGGGHDVASSEMVG